MTKIQPSQEKKEKRNQLLTKAVAVYAKLQKQKGKDKIITARELREHGISKHVLEEIIGGITTLRLEAFKKYPDLIRVIDPEKPTQAVTTKEDLLTWYVGLREKLGHTPSRKDIRADGQFTMNMVNNHYGGIVHLETEARKLYPDLFHDVALSTIKTKNRIKDLRADLRKYKKFVITTAVTGCKVHEPFYENLKLLCKRENAKLLIVVCSDPAKPRDSNNEEVITKALLDETIVIENSWLNNNLFISVVKETAKQINPLTGMGRIMKKEGSAIFASPKISLEYNSIKNEKEKMPRFIASTGCVTRADYNSEMYMAQRTAYIADSDHQLGAIYVEIANNELFHFTQIECKSDDGTLHLRNKSYTQDGVLDVRPEALILGDLHSGFTCPNAKKAWIEVAELCKPKYIAIHDGFNGYSVNGHIENDFIAKAIRAMRNLDCVRTEIISFAEDLRFWASKCETLLIVPSNHNDWLERWLRRGGYLKDPRNHYIGVCLAKAMLEGKSALRYAVEEIAGVKCDNIRWLDRNEDVEIGGVQINCHGDVATKGSKGSLRGMVRSYISSMSGHSHTAGIIQDAWSVGTSGFLQEEYNNGPGVWTNTSGLVYSNGEKALINAIGDKWKI